MVVARTHGGAKIAVKAIARRMPEHGDQVCAKNIKENTIRALTILAQTSYERTMAVRVCEGDLYPVADSLVLRW